MSYVGKVLSGGEGNPIASTLYGVCETAADVPAKIVSLENFDALITGVTIQIKFKYSNTASQPTLNVNGTGAMPIFTDGVNYPGNTKITSWYPNSVVSLTYDNTAWRMNDVDINAAGGLNDLFGLIYPVGAIYMSVNGTSPATLFGGAWEQIRDTFLLCAGTTYAAASTGGAANVALETANIPSHTHQIGGHTHSTPSHTHSVPAHTHGLNGHSHSIPALSGTAASDGAHTHSLNKSFYADMGAAWRANAPMTDVSVYTVAGAASGSANSAGAHTHSVTTTANTTGGNSGTTASSAVLTTGASSGTTGNNAEFTSGATGSGTAHNNMPPYLAVYVWKRTA